MDIDFIFGQIIRYVLSAKAKDGQSISFAKPDEVRTQ
jgi:hypothetical protein